MRAVPFLCLFIASCSMPHKVVDVTLANIECLQNSSILTHVQINGDFEVVAKLCKKVDLGKDS